MRLLHGRLARRHPGLRPDRDRARDTAHPHPRRHAAPYRGMDHPAGPQPGHGPRRANAPGQVHDPRPRPGLHRRIRRGPRRREHPDRAVQRPDLDAWSTYQAALKGSPDRFELNKAAGRLAVELRRYEDAVQLLSKAQYRLSNDPEIHYYLGAAWAGLNQNRKARAEWEGAQRQPQFRAAARYEMARLSAREGDRTEALRLLAFATAERPDMVRAGGMEVALLRGLGQTAQARQRLAWWLSRDPASTMLRHEEMLLGGSGDALWAHLAADPERVIETAVDYMEIGAWDDAITLLSRRYPAVDARQADPGAVLPQDYPLVAYYRGYCREKLGQPGKQDFEEASRQSVRYVFPNRASSLPVLRRAIESNPGDATAHYLSGELLLSGGSTGAA